MLSSVLWKPQSCVYGVSRTVYRVKLVITDLTILSRWENRCSTVCSSGNKGVGEVRAAMIASIICFCRGWCNYVVFVELNGPFIFDNREAFPDRATPTRV
jgi:hypothetical protein